MQKKLCFLLLLIFPFFSGFATQSDSLNEGDRLVLLMEEGYGYHTTGFFGKSGDYQKALDKALSDAKLKLTTQCENIAGELVANPKVMIVSYTSSSVKLVMSHICKF